MMDATIGHKAKLDPAKFDACKVTARLEDDGFVTAANDAGEREIVV